MVKVTYKIDMAMAERGLTFRALEELSGVSKSMIHAICNGERDATVTTLCTIATAIEMKPEELYSY